MWSPNEARAIFSLQPAAAKGQATSAFGHTKLCRLELPPLGISGRSVSSPQDGQVKLSVAFDQPDVTVYKSQPGGSVTLYHPLCHASRDSKMGGFAHP